MARVALVTGAARGIGAATVARLVADGWAVVAVDGWPDPSVGYPLGSAADLDALARVHGDAVATVGGDVREEAVLAAAVRAAEERFGGLDAAVAVAGVIAGAPLWEMDAGTVETLLGVNLTAVATLARVAVPALLARPQPRAGRFVAVASAAATRGLARLAAYGAAKAGVTGLVRGLAADLAGTGVTANAVSPGSTRGAMLSESARIYGLADVEGFAEHHLLGRLLEPAEVAAAIGWLCSEQAGGVTGAVLPVDAGLSV